MFAHPTCLTGLQALQVIGMDSLMCPFRPLLSAPPIFLHLEIGAHAPMWQGTYTGICPVPN